MLKNNHLDNKVPTIPQSVNKKMPGKNTTAKRIQKYKNKIKELEDLVGELRNQNKILSDYNALLKKTYEAETKQIELKTELIDPIFDKKNERESLFPIQHEKIWDMYLKAKSSFWVDNEVDLSEDVNDWKLLTENEQYFIKHVLAFFAGSDFIVNENLKGNNFMDNITIMELEFFYRYQLMMEDIHSQMYAQMLNEFVKDKDENMKLRNAVKTIPVIKEKADWARKWIRDGTIIERIIAFSIVEGIFFSGSFCAIYWLKSKSKMPGLTHSNELISKDEGMHRDMACIIYQEYVYNKLDPEIVKHIIREAVAIEKKFICESLPVDLIGMNSKLMSEYIEYVADHLSFNLIDEKIYGRENPYTWMNLISMQSKANFFEKRVSEYSKQMVLSTNSRDDSIVFDEPF